MTGKLLHRKDSDSLDIPTASRAMSSVTSRSEQAMVLNADSAGASGGRRPSSGSSANAENTPMPASAKKHRKTAVPKLPVLKEATKKPPPPGRPAVEPPDARKTTPQYPCICPGEKYPLTRSVCHGRQSRNFDRCLDCEFLVEEWRPPRKGHREK